MLSSMPPFVLFFVGAIAVVCIWALSQTALPNILATNVDRLLSKQAVSSFLENVISP